GVDMPLDAETATDVEREAAHARLRKLQHRRRLAPDPMHDLGGRPDRHRIRTRVMHSDHAAAFHRRGGITVMMKASLHPAWRSRERGNHVYLAHRERADKA